MLDFNRSLFENTRGRTLLCAHRGLSGANVPCNTMAAFKAAVMSGADMVELDVTKSIDGKYFVFHPGMEHAHLCKRKPIALMKAKDVEKLRFVNQDNCVTDHKVNTLEEVFDYLKGKCYINVDKYWTDIPGITACIRRCGVEKQAVVKTAIKNRYLDELKEYAPDLMFLPIVRDKDEITDSLIAQGVNCVGAEVLFESEDAPVASPAYIESMHKKGLIVFANAIVYNKNDVIAAGHSDDNSFVISPDYGWGWLADRGFDIIQTDFTPMAANYLSTRGK